MTPTPEPEKPHLLTLKLRGSVLWKSLLGIGIAALGLFLLTGWAWSVWLFLLYPLLIALLLFSLGTLALHLLRRYSGS